MRALPLIVLVALAVSGCFGKKQPASPPPGATGAPGATAAAATASVSHADPNLIVTPDTGLTGKVVKVNPAARFVVLNFPVGHLPAVNQPMQLYRRGLRVGEVRVTGPQLDDNIVGDIVNGDAQEGDVVRDK
jgi:hypothetical protein